MLCSPTYAYAEKVNACSRAPAEVHIHLYKWTTYTHLDQDLPRQEKQCSHLSSALQPVARWTVAGSHQVEWTDLVGRRCYQIDDGTLQLAGFWYSKRLHQGTRDHFSLAKLLFCQPPVTDR